MIPCWFYKMAGFWFQEDTRPLPAQLQHHLKACSSCRRHFAMHSSLINRLSIESSQTFQPEPPFLYEKIMAAIRHQETVSYSNTPARPAWLMAATACSLLAILAILVFSNTPQPSQNTATAIASNQPVTAPSIFTPSITFPTNSIAQWTALLDDPLQTEMTSVIKDARNAALVLASNFLPPDYLQ